MPPSPVAFVFLASVHLSCTLLTVFRAVGAREEELPTDGATFRVPAE